MAISCCMLSIFSMHIHLLTIGNRLKTCCMLSIFSMHIHHVTCNVQAINNLDNLLSEKFPQLKAVQPTQLSLK